MPPLVAVPMGPMKAASVRGMLAPAVPRLLNHCSVQSILGSDGDGAGRAAVCRTLSHVQIARAHERHRAVIGVVIAPDRVSLPPLASSTENWRRPSW